MPVPTPESDRMDTAATDVTGVALSLALTGHEPARKGGVYDSGSPTSRHPSSVASRD